MSCEICGRGTCTRSFHSLEEQLAYDNAYDGIKDKIKSNLLCKINRLSTISNYGDNEDYIKLDEVINIINDYL
jgi:hypothetical protein